jgi:hypothetical protein
MVINLRSISDKNPPIWGWKETSPNLGLVKRGYNTIWPYLLPLAEFSISGFRFRISLKIE